MYSHLSQGFLSEVNATNSAHWFSFQGTNCYTSHKSKNNIPTKCFYLTFSAEMANVGWGKLVCTLAETLG